jgi:hypothetical protein
MLGSGEIISQAIWAEQKSSPAVEGRHVQIKPIKFD